MKTIRALSVALLLITGGAAVFGGGSMLIDPSGRPLGLSIDLLDGTPFISYFIPGLVLFLAVGILSLVTAVLTIFKNSYSARLTVLQGTILACWIGVQAFMLQMMDPIQVTVGGIGFTLFCLGLFQADEEPGLP